LNESLREIVSIEKANQKMYDAFGIIHFFDDENDLQTLKETISENKIII
jgi:hypothetical protein